MTIGEKMNKDLASLEGLYGTTFTYKTESYPCIVGNDWKLSIVGIGGFATDADLVVRVRKGAFTDGQYPHSQEVITYKEKDFRIHKVDADPFDITLILFCVSCVQGI